MYIELLGYSILALFIIIIVFLVLRSVVLWYWKIDHVVSTLDEINRSLKLLIGKEKDEEMSNSSSKIKYDSKGRWTCPKCGYLNDSFRKDCFDCKYNIIKEI